MTNLKAKLKETMEAWRKRLAFGDVSPLWQGVVMLNELLEAYDEAEALVPPAERPALIARAREKYAKGSDDDIEVDDDADFSPADGEGWGCWVSAWVWLRNADKEED